MPTQSEPSGHNGAPGFFAAIGSTVVALLMLSGCDTVAYPPTIIDVRAADGSCLRVHLSNGEVKATYTVRESGDPAQSAHEPFPCRLPPVQP